MLIRHYYFGFRCGENEHVYSVLIEDDFSVEVRFVTNSIERICEDLDIKENVGIMFQPAECDQSIVAGRFEGFDFSRCTHDELVAFFEALAKYHDKCMLLKVDGVLGFADFVNKHRIIK